MRRLRVILSALILVAAGAAERSECAGVTAPEKRTAALPRLTLLPPSPGSPESPPPDRASTRVRGFSLVSEGTWWALNPTRGLQARLGDSGVVVTSTALQNTAWRLGLHLERFGREGSLKAQGAVRPEASGDRIRFRRGDLVEWYRNDGRGLVQGFTLGKPPARRGLHSPILLEMSLRGDGGASLGEEAGSVLFRTEEGIEALRYKGPVVRDAAGAEIRSSIILHPGRMQIRIEDRSALYPLAVDAVLTSADSTLEGDRAGAAFGSSVASAGDVDGDGFEDVLVGAPFTTDTLFRQGRAFLYPGSPTGVGTTPVWTALGDQEAANFGWSVAGAGDVNGDGYDDVVVGAYHYGNGQFNEGRAFVYLGSASGLAASPSWVTEGDQDDAWYGYSVASAGDVNGDGYADVVVGAPQFQNSQPFQGRALLYLGSVSGLAASPAWFADGDRSGAYLGWSVAGAGDVNGDGRSDVLAGAPQSADPDRDLLSEGRVLLYLGSSAGLPPTSDWDAWGGRRAGFFGFCVAGAGDVNGDGYDDLLVGAPNTTTTGPGAGRAVLFLGAPSVPDGTPAWDSPGVSFLARYGTSVAAAGDFNGDGYDDVTVGEPDHDRSAEEESVGRAHVHRGSASGPSLSAAPILEGDQPFGTFGASAAAGDLNGDGFSDVIVGAPGEDAGEGPQQGRVIVVLGRPDPRPPVAVATAPPQAECASPSGAAVLLDGSASEDPDSSPGTNDDIASFEWFEDYGQAGQTLLGTGETLGVTLPLGPHDITLRATDTSGESDTDQLAVGVVDTAEPSISMGVSPAVLWPPTHGLVAARATVNAGDACGNPSVVLVSITSNEPDDAPGSQDGSTLFDIQGAAPGTPDFDFKLRAERSELGSGRVYTVVYRATDGSGNSALGTAFVSVPLDLEGGGGSFGRPERPRKVSVLSLPVAR